MESSTHEGPPIRADTLLQRLALLLAIFAFLAVPLGLVGGALIAVAREGESVFSVLGDAAFPWPGLVLLGVPGLLLYSTVLEIGRRFGIVGPPLLILALPLSISGWAYYLGMPYLASGAGSTTGTVTLVSFGIVVVFSRSRRVF